MATQTDPLRQFHADVLAFPGEAKLKCVQCGLDTTPSELAECLECGDRYCGRCHICSCDRAVLEVAERLSWLRPAPIERALRYLARKTGRDFAKADRPGTPVAPR